MIRNYLFMMGITYLVVDIIYNIVYPGFLAFHAFKDAQSRKDNRVYNYATMQLMDDIEVQLILLFNLQMIFFYNKTSFNVDNFISQEQTLRRSLSLEE